MVALFDLAKVHVTAAKFDLKKLQWMNGEYVKRLPKDVFTAELVRRVEAAGMAVPEGYDLSYLVDQLQIRTKFLNDIPSACRCFFSDDFEMDEKAVEKRLKKDGVKALLLDLVERFRQAPDWSAGALENLVKELSQGNGMGPWVHPIRVAVSGRGEGIGLFEMLQLLGKERTLKRLKDAAEKYCQ
jgi:glutamyl-tRNA synthetase